MTDRAPTDWPLVAAQRGIQIDYMRTEIEEAVFFLESEQDGGVTLEMRIANALSTLREVLSDADGETPAQKETK